MKMQELEEIQKQYKRAKELQKEYAHIKWSSSNHSIKIIDMDDNYLVNALRKVAEKEWIAGRYPQVKEFQTYNGLAYKSYGKIFYAEYKLRSLKRRAYEIKDQQKQNYNDQV